MDVALIGCILRRCPVNLGYTIIRTMISIPNLITCSLMYGHFISRILKFFKVLIYEPSCKPSKSIGDEAVCALWFEWKNKTCVKFTDNKFTFLAPSDDRPLNAVVPADQLPNFSLLFRGQCRRWDPPASEEVTLQQLMDEVRTLSVRLTDFEQHILVEHQRFSQQHQQLIHGQFLLFEHLGIPYLYPPPSSPPQ